MLCLRSKAVRLGLRCVVEVPVLCLHTQRQEMRVQSCAIAFGVCAFACALVILTALKIEPPHVSGSNREAFGTEVGEDIRLSRG